MAVATMNPSSWVEQQIVPTMVARGCFGNTSEQRLENTRCKVTSKETGDDHFSSTVIYINLELKFEHQAPQSYRLFVKVPPEDPHYRKYMQTDVLFYNESIMYMEVIPFMEEFLRKRQVDSLGHLFPKCYYAESGTGVRDIIVLEDMVSLGFTPSVERTALDYEHCAVALKQLARYHALCYGMKKTESSRFHGIVKKFRARIPGNSAPEDLNYFFKTTSCRAIYYLEGRQEMDQDILDKLKARLEHASQLLVDLLTPKEPLAVLCHGDFCRNNILFRYDSGKPCDAILFDLQAPTYASPAIDLSSFMYMNTSSELRAQHWDDLFGEYHRNLTRTLAYILGCSVEELLPEYGLEEFQKEFVAHGLYGYMVSAFFLGEMMEDSEHHVDYYDIVQKNIRYLADLYVLQGGELASQKLGDILKHLASMGAI